jgi:hypothetical protein
MTTKISQNLIQPSYGLVYENILTSTATEIDISGLTGIAHGGYRIEVDYYNNATDGATTEWFNGFVYFNQNYTLTNYDFHYIYVGPSAVNGVSNGNSSYAWYTDKNGPCKLRMDVSIVDNNGTKYVAASVKHYGKSDQSDHTVTFRNSVTDLTDIRINGVGVSSSPLEIGTVIRVFRKL